MLPIQFDSMSPVQAQTFAYRYIEAVKSGERSGVYTLRAILKQEGWSIFGVFDHQLQVNDIDAVAKILEAFAFQASGSLADKLRENDRDATRASYRK